MSFFYRLLITVKHNWFYPIWLFGIPLCIIFIYDKQSIQKEQSSRNDNWIPYEEPLVECGNFYQNIQNPCFDDFCFPDVYCHWNPKTEDGIEFAINYSMPEHNVLKVDISSPFDAADYSVIHAYSRRALNYRMSNTDHIVWDIYNTYLNHTVGYRLPNFNLSKYFIQYLFFFLIFFFI